jgi:hypothetical protein
MDAIDFDFDDDDDLSTALGTETLAVRDIVPEGFDNTPRARGLPECGGQLLLGLLCANGVRYAILPCNLMRMRASLFIYKETH